MTTVAQAYFHIRQVRLNNEEIKKLGELASGLAAEAAADLYPPEFVIEVRLSDGSLKGWITVGGILLGAYGAIANYKGFKESVSELNSDAKVFGEKVIDLFLQKSDLPSGKVYRRERRTKTPGRIKRLIERRERIDAHRDDLPRGAVEKELIAIEMLLQEILADVDPSERAVVRNLIGEDAPPTLPIDMSRVGMLPFRQEQLRMIDDRGVPRVEPLPDYIHRFRLSDGPYQNRSPLGSSGSLTGGSSPAIMHRSSRDGN